MSDLDRVAVTGAAGFLGSAVCRALCARGVRVRALDLPGADARRLAGVDLERAAADVTDARGLAAALQGSSAVIHSAAIYEIGARDPARMRAVNVDGAANVLAWAEARGALMVHVGTVAALGPTGARTADESHWNPAPPRTPYESTKREAHALLRAATARGARVRMALPATIFGPDDPSRIGQLHALLARGWIRAAVRADTRMPFVYVDDCADGVVRVAERGADGGEYILCADVATPRAWLGAFAAACDRSPPWFFLPDPALDAVGAVLARLPARGALARTLREGVAMSAGASWDFSGARARRELAWSPRTFAAALTSTAAFYRGRTG